MEPDVLSSAADALNGAASTTNSAEIFGILAAICMICGYVPQAWVTIKTRDTDGIAMPTFIAMGLGSLFFVIYGILLGAWSLWATNSVTLLCSLIIVVIKIQNDLRKRKAHK